jgi:hypothetical protein
MSVSDAVLTQILAQLNALQVSQQTMQAKVRLITSEFRWIMTFHAPLDQLDSISKSSSSAHTPSSGRSISGGREGPQEGGIASEPTSPLTRALSPSTPPVGAPAEVRGPTGATDKEREKLLYPGRVLLTSELSQSRNLRGPIGS